MKSLFDKYFGHCFSGYTTSKTLGLTVNLHKNATSLKRATKCVKPVHTVNRSRHIRYKPC